MNMISRINRFYQTVPHQVTSFLSRAVVISVSWKLVYHLILLPNQVPNRGLTRSTAALTSLCLKTFHSLNSTIVEGYSTDFYSSILVDNLKVIGIADPCNGLELMALYVGFLFCIPYSFKKKLFYTIGGLVGIFAINIGRCYVLALLSLHHSPLTNLAHHFIFTSIIYSLIFVAWVKYSKKYFANES